jgi:Ca-activated chloride channel family protein
VYPGGTIDLFAGEPLVLVGRYCRGGAASVLIEGRLNGSERSFQFPVEFTEKSRDDTSGFAERLWALRRIGEIIDELDLCGKNEELIQELVELSTRHGVLTPYTAFLAEDDVPLRDVATNVRRAGGKIELLDRAAGKSGFAQRSFKADLQQAHNLALPGSAVGRVQSQFSGGVAYRDAETDNVVLGGNLRQIGNKAFFYRAGDMRWVDSTVTEEMERNARRVVQFSDDYFKLADSLDRRLLMYLALEEPTLINLDGQVWQIDAAK